jgi:hypothetical protein
MVAGDVVGATVGVVPLVARLLESSSQPTTSESATTRSDGGRSRTVRYTLSPWPLPVYGQREESDRALAHQNSVTFPFSTLTGSCEPEMSST